MLSPFCDISLYLLVQSGENIIFTVIDSYCLLVFSILTRYLLSYTCLHFVILWWTLLAWGDENKKRSLACGVFWKTEFQNKHISWHLLTTKISKFLEVRFSHWTHFFFFSSQFIYAEKASLKLRSFSFNLKLAANPDPLKLCCMC